MYNWCISVIQPKSVVSSSHHISRVSGTPLLFQGSLPMVTLVTVTVATAHGNMIVDLKRGAQRQDSDPVTLLLLQRWRNAAGGETGRECNYSKSGCTSQCKVPPVKSSSGATSCRCWTHHRGASRLLNAFRTCHALDWRYLVFTRAI